MTTAAAPVAASALRRRRVLVVGPLPPPYHGGSVATGHVLQSGLCDDWEVMHLDTTDRRGLDNMGRLDVGNVVLAVRHAVRFTGMLLRRTPDVAYIPIAQNTPAVLRDCLFLGPALLAGRRVVVHVHGGGFGEYHATAPAPVRWLVKALLRRAARVIVLGDALRDSVRGIVPEQRIAVVPNGVPDACGGVQRDVSAGPLRLLFLGNLYRAKGFIETLAAVERLVAAGRDVVLDAAGGWGGDDDRSAAAPWLERLGPRVHLHGVVDTEAKAALLRRADVLVFPTRYECEAHPYVVLEAMSAGLPVVTTARGALAETVLDGETGLIVRDGDVDALAAALLRLDGDAALRQRLGDAARARYQERYTLAAWSDRLRSVMEEAVA